jgi:hypothetical protein
MAMTVLLAIALMVGCGGEPTQPTPVTLEDSDTGAAAPEPAEGSAPAAEKEGSAEEGSAAEKEGSAAESEASADLETSIKEALADFKAGMESKDIDKMMTPISANFQHYEWGDKKMLRGFVSDQMDQGALDEAEVDIENAEITVDGDIVTVYPVEMVTAAMAMTLEFTIEKDDDNVWRVTSMEVEGI